MARTPSQMLELGTELPTFSLQDPEGKTYDFPNIARGKPVLVSFVCNHCPFVVHIKNSWAEVCNQFVERGGYSVAINSNDVENYPADAPPEMAKMANELHLKFPFVFDENQDVAKKFRAACTPDFYVFSPDHKLAYRGQMDDSRPGNDQPVNGKDLLAACEAVLANKPFVGEQKPSLGCNIKWKPGGEPSYYG